MTDQEYLESVLKSQTLENGSLELSALREHRADVEGLLRTGFADASPNIRYGGSHAKGTMNKVSYDLDLACYFDRDDCVAGDTLEEIYENVAQALSVKYRIERKASAIRLRDCEAGTDFHIDVVPGRFVDAESDDVFLYQSLGEKDRLKTNLRVHINHVKESGVVPAIRLVKLWAFLNQIHVKTFVLELLVIDKLAGRTHASLSDQLAHFFEQLRDGAGQLHVADPANPFGNDLSAALSEDVQSLLGTTARQTLLKFEASGWVSVFGDTPEFANARRIAELARLASAATVRPQPHCDNG